MPCSHTGKEQMSLPAAFSVPEVGCNCLTAAGDARALTSIPCAATIPLMAVFSFSATCKTHIMTLRSMFERSAAASIATVQVHYPVTRAGLLSPAQPWHRTCIQACSDYLQALLQSLKSIQQHTPLAPHALTPQLGWPIPHLPGSSSSCCMAVPAAHLSPEDLPADCG